MDSELSLAAVGGNRAAHKSSSWSCHGFLGGSNVRTCERSYYITQCLRFINRSLNLPRWDTM